MKLGKNLKCARSIAKSSFRLFSAKNDFELHTSFGFTPRIKYIWSLLSKEGLSPLQLLVDSGMSITLLDAANLRSSLENPLLKKYGFNVDEFVQGAQSAIENICETAQSPEFYDYCVSNKSQETYSYLSDNCDPSIVSELESDIIKNHLSNSLKGVRYEAAGLYMKNIQKVGIFFLDIFQVDHNEVVIRDDDSKNSELWYRKNFPPGCLKVMVFCHFMYERNTEEEGGMTSAFAFANFEAVLSEGEGLGPWKLSFIKSW